MERGGRLSAAEYSHGLGRIPRDPPLMFDRLRLGVLATTLRPLEDAPQSCAAFRVPRLVSGTPLELHGGFKITTEDTPAGETAFLAAVNCQISCS